MTATWEKEFGAHRLSKETERIFSIQFGCSPSESEVRAILDAMGEESAGRPVFVLVDLTRAETLSAPARRASSEAAKKFDFRGLAIYGASFHMKVIAKLVGGAIALFMKSELPQEFFENREAARAWLERLAMSPVSERG